MQHITRDVLSELEDVWRNRVSNLHGRGATGTAPSCGDIGQHLLFSSLIFRVSRLSSCPLIVILRSHGAGYALELTRVDFNR